MHNEYLFQHKDIHKYTWNKDSVEQHSIIDFCIVSVNLLSSVVDVCVERGAELLLTITLLSAF